VRPFPVTVCAVVGALCLSALAPVANAAVTARASLVTANNVTRVVVKLAGVASLPAPKRPTGVTAKSGALTFRLKKVSATTWQSTALSAPIATAVRALSGKKIQVVLRSKSGTKTLRPVLSVPTGLGAPTTPPPPPAPPPAPGVQPLFAAPATELTGQPAYDHFKQYFVTARFTDCPNGGWPNCAVEQLYDLCSTGPNVGSYAYHRYTNVSGADINAYGTYQVSGAAAHTDGSWSVEYWASNYGNTSYYSWNVSATGVVTGYYWFNKTVPSGAPEVLGPLAYKSNATCQ